MPQPRTPKALTPEEEIAVVAAVRAGRSRRAVARLFDVSPPTIGKVVRRAAAAAPVGSREFLAGCLAAVPAPRGGT